VRAVVWYGGDRHIPLLSREHNDANVLSLGARFMDKTLAEIVVKEWLDTPFSHDERHERRVKKIDSGTIE
jgi:ribose 5-phosphate isomerase B